MRLDDQPIHCEQLALKLSDNTLVKIPAAWVISVGNRQPVEQLLYLPSRPVPVQAFDERSDMEHWLSGQLLVPPELTTRYISFEYTAKNGPLTTGLTALFAPGPQASRTGVFAQAPTLESLELIGAFDNVDQSSPFDSLAADIPLALRQSSLRKQLAALETLLGDDGDSDRHRTFNDTLKTLEVAEQAADKAAFALLYRSRVLDLETFNREFGALYQARKNGLQAEARLQRSLDQLDNVQLDMLQAILDPADETDSDVCRWSTRALAIKPRHWTVRLSSPDPRRCSILPHLTACCSTGPALAAACSASPIAGSWKVSCSKSRNRIRS
jgi:hypothetical protein